MVCHACGAHAMPHVLTPLMRPCAPRRTVYCEVFLVNDSRPLSLDHYYGIFIGEEKIKRVGMQ